MTAAGVLAQARQLGIVLSIEKGELHYRGPKGAMTEDLRAKFSVLREPIFAELKAERSQQVRLRLQATYAELVAGGYSRERSERLKACGDLAHQVALEVGRFVDGDVAELEQLDAALARWKAAIANPPPQPSRS